MLPEPGRFPGASGSEKKKAFSGIQGYVNNGLNLESIPQILRYCIYERMNLVLIAVRPCCCCLSRLEATLKTVNN